MAGDSSTAYSPEPTLSRRTTLSSTSTSHEEWTLKPLELGGDINSLEGTYCFPDPSGHLDILLTI